LFEILHDTVLRCVIRRREILTVPNIEKKFTMTKRLNIRASMIGLVLSTMLVMPSPAVAQMSGGMGDKMMPMGEGQMEGEMPMPAKMPPKKPGCCGMGGVAAESAPMPATSAKRHRRHRAKARPVAARRAPAAIARPAATARRRPAPAATPRPAATATPAPAKPAPMPMKM